MDSKSPAIYHAVIIASALIGVILAFFVVILIRNHRRNRTLYKAKILAEITTLENERKRMATDLHDDLGPVLVGIKMKLNSIAVSDSEDQQTLDKAMSNLNGLMARMKEISNDLLPAVLVKKGLTEAVHFFIDDIRKNTALKIDFRHDELTLLTEQMNINIYRIITEIINNTIKHAKAQTLFIEIKKDHKQIFLHTKDDGKGFDYNDAMKNHLGLGLRTLLSRAEMLNGILYIDSKPGSGTQYNFEIPLNHA